MSYIPLLEDEQEALQRMIEGEDAYVEIVGWGYHGTPTITAGDKRIQVRFHMEFVKPVGVSIPVKFFTLRLKLRNGHIVFEDTKTTVFNGLPLFVSAGLQIDMVWDISVDKLSKEFQDTFLPGIKGRVVAAIEGGSMVRKA